MNDQTLVGSALLGWTTTGAFFLKWASRPKQEAEAIGRRRRGRRTCIVSLPLKTIWKYQRFPESLHDFGQFTWILKLGRPTQWWLCTWMDQCIAGHHMSTYSNPVLLSQFMNNPLKIEYNRNVDSWKERKIRHISCQKNVLECSMFGQTNEKIFGKSYYPSILLFVPFLNSKFG